MGSEGERDYLDSAAEVYAIAKFYASEGDPDMLRRVESRIIADGHSIALVEARMREKATALAATPKPVVEEESADA